MRTIDLELRDPESVTAATTDSYDAVVHLAAVASTADAKRDPSTAWDINAVGTARLCEALGARRTAGVSDPTLLIVSTAEVYGAGLASPDLRRESDPVAPCSPYAASKCGAEIAALEVWRRTGLRVVIARPFPHTGRGQDDRFVVPAFARRIAHAKAGRQREVAVGNLAPVRDFLHVSDVVEAYVNLLEHGEAGEIYNVASGGGTSIREVFEGLARVLHADVVPRVDPTLARPTDIQHLVGDPQKLHARTGWTARVALDVVLNEVVSAQAD